MRVAAIMRGGVTLTGAASDAGSGIASLRFQYAPAGGSSWADGCVATSAPWSCALATATLSDGLYDLRVVATDAAGNASAPSVVAGRRIDNTAPSATMGDPGAFLRATVTLTATAAAAGSGVASLRTERVDDVDRRLHERRRLRELRPEHDDARRRGLRPSSRSTTPPTRRSSRSAA